MTSLDTHPSGARSEACGGWSWTKTHTSTNTNTKRVRAPKPQSCRPAQLTSCRGDSLTNAQLSVRLTVAPRQSHRSHRQRQRRSAPRAGLTVGGSQFDHVRHFVAVGRIRSKRCARGPRADRKCGSDRRRRHLTSAAARRRGRCPGRVLRPSRVSSVRRRSDAPLDAGSLRGAPRDETWRRSSLGTMSHSVGSGGP